MPYMTETEVSNLHQIIDRLESRLKEAEAIIKELDAEIPSSTVMFYGWLGEVRRRAAAFLAGGEK